jgi:hypothetical protein
VSRREIGAGGDAKGERVTNNPAANKLLTYNYREPYQFPG